MPLVNRQYAGVWRISFSTFSPSGVECISQFWFELWRDLVISMHHSTKSVLIKLLVRVQDKHMGLEISAWVQNMYNEPVP